MKKVSVGVISVAMLSARELIKRHVALVIDDAIRDRRIPPLVTRDQIAAAFSIEAGRSFDRIVAHLRQSGVATAGKDGKLHLYPTDEALPVCAAFLMETPRLEMLPLRDTWEKSKHRAD